MEKAGDYKIDPNWEKYRERFNTLPSFYFHSLVCPETVTQAKHLLEALEVEIDSITRQFKERQTELESPAFQKKPEVIQEYKIWEVKAQRAQRMKEAQIKVLQAWLADNSTPPEKRLSELENHCSRLSEAIKLLCFVQEEKQNGKAVDPQLTKVISDLVRFNEDS